MPGLSTQALAYFYRLWLQWRSNFKALMLLLWSAWFASCPGPPLVPAGWPESPGLPDRGQVPVLAGSPLPWALGQGSEPQAWNHFYAFGHKETWVRSLIQEDPMSTEQQSPRTRTTEPTQQSPRIQLLSPRTATAEAPRNLEPVLHNKRSPHNEKPVQRNYRVSPTHHNQRKARTTTKNLSKINKTNP